MNTIDLAIEGMTCMGCVANVTRLLKSEPGVMEAIVTLTPGAAQVQFDVAKTSVDKLTAKLEEAGYEAAIK